LGHVGVLRVSSLCGQRPLDIEKKRKRNRNFKTKSTSKKKKNMVNEQIKEMRQGANAWQAQRIL